jgi:phage terminase small subunit
MTRAVANCAVGLNGLLAQQQLFVDKYMENGRNGRAAAVAAGYQPRNADRLLKTPAVIAEINRRIEEYTKAAGIDRVEWLEKLKRVVEVDRRKFFLPNGGIAPPSMWTEEEAKAVSAYNAGTVTAAEKITFGDYFQQVLDVLKYTHPIAQKVEHKVTHEVEVDSAAIVARLRGRVIDVTPE